MANIQIKFKCISDSGDHLTVEETQGEILIEFFKELEFVGDVFLDKSTAIRLAKTLRTEINKIES